MKLAVACADFVQHCRVARNLAQNSLKAYQADLREFHGFVQQHEGRAPVVADCSRPTARAYLQHLIDERNLKPTTVRRRLACIKSMFRWLEREGVVNSCPVQGPDFKVRTPPPLPRTLTAEELHALLTEAAQRAGLHRGAAYDPATIPATLDPHECRRLTALVAIEVLFASGMRVAELASTRLQDLNLGEGSIRVRGKGSRWRTVFLADERVAGLVKSYLGPRAGLARDTAALLINSKGRPASSQFIRSLVREAGEAAGLTRRVTPHMLRHSCATHNLRCGVDIRFLQKLLGHHSIATTQRYAEVDSRALRRALTHAGCRDRLLVEGGCARDN